MGRYYTGDIDGKFWFGVQSSDDADFFGEVGVEPNCLEYYYSEDDIPAITKGIKTCMKELGVFKPKLDKFFKENDGYNDQILADYLKENTGVVENLLKWYARLELGEKILKCVKDTGSCEFDAEL